MYNQVINLLKSGQIAVIPTDTIYGMVGSALNPQTVEEIYRLRKRAKDKPMIILISDLNDLKSFNIALTDKQKKFLKKIWPNPVSVILPVSGGKWQYLHRGTNTLAFRIPKNDGLVSLLKEVGPLVAPSANFAGEKYAETIEQAKRYFGDHVSFYINGGKIISKPSTLIFLQADGVVTVLRPGSYSIFT